MSAVISDILGALFFMLVIAFFAGVEIAFLAASVVKIELKARQGSTQARILSFFKKNTSKVLITVLVGIEIALILYTKRTDGIFGVIYERLFHAPEPEFDLFVTLIKAIINTLIILFFAEFIPKAIFRRLADSIIYPSAYLLQFFYWLLWIPVQLMHQLTQGVFRLLNIPVEERFVGINKEELSMYLQELIDANEAHNMQEMDTEILSNALSFNEIKVRSMMIPRTDIVALPMEADIPTLMQEFIESKHSRILVYEETIDNIKGFVHSTQMFHQPANIPEIVQPVLMIPEFMPASTLLSEFVEKKRSMAIVVDEFGGTMGLVTVEDLVEEVFGDIEDEYDEAEQAQAEDDMVFEQHQDGTYTIGARQLVEDLNENHHLDIPTSEHYTTLGGFIVNQIGDIVREGEILADIHELYTFTILSASPTRIIKVKLGKK